MTAQPNPPVPDPPADDVIVAVGVGAEAVQLTSLLNDEFTAPFSDVGIGTITMLADDPQRAHIYEGQLLRWVETTTYKVICACYIESWEVKISDPAEDAGETITIKGSTSAGRWKHALVYPEGGIFEIPPGGIFSGLRLGVSPATSNRYFNWAHPALDLSSWTAPDLRYQVCSPENSGGPPYGRWGKPDGWLDGDAYWIWSRPIDGYNADPVGASLFRTTLNLYEGKNTIIDVACDDAFVLFVDGSPILTFDSPPSVDGWSKTHSVNVSMSAGLHHIAVQATNYFGGTPAGLLLSIREQPGLFTAGGTETILRRTDGYWVCQDYPELFPSWTAGQIFVHLFAEATERGALTTAAVTGSVTPYMTLDFDETYDSAGTLWPPIGETIIRVGDSMFDVLEQLSESWIEWDQPADINDGNTLQAWVAEGAPLAGYSGNPMEPAQGELAPGHGVTTDAIIGRGVNAQSIVHRFEGG
jgi:hypothetical protein